MINENEKQDKILNFNIIVGNQNNNVANEFLSLAHWNVSEAVNLYLYMNSNSNNPYINNQNNLPIFKYITEYSFVKPGILNKFSSLLQFPFLNDNEECCYKFIGKINNLVKTGEIFMNLLKTNKGVIILYNKDTFYKVFEQLDVINNDYQNNYINSIVIYPIIDNSFEGKNLINNLHIKRFPCYLFCQYKSKDVFYIVDKMEGIFYLQTFKNTLFPQIYNSNVNNINIPQNNNNIINNEQANQNKEKNNINNNKRIINDKDQKKFLFNNQMENNSNNNNQIHKNNQDKNQKNNDLFNKDLSLLNNNNKKAENNNNQINNNQNLNHNNKENNISDLNQPQQRKEYIPDYRNYEFEDNFINPGFDLNQILSQSQIPSYPNNNNLNDDNLLSDSQLRKFQDNEMKKLEKMEEEKEKKEREEKEKVRKEEEEKRKREEKLNEDKEIFSMLIPPEPEDDNPDKCIIIFRFPDGEKNIQRKFLKTDKISVLYDYIRSLGKEIYSEEEYNNFSIIQTFPFKNFEKSLNNTLEEEGLFPNSVLQIKENE